MEGVVHYGFFSVGLFAQHFVRRIYVAGCLLLFSHSVVPNSLWPHGLQHARLLCPSPSPGACSNSCPLSQWCHPTCHPLLLLPSVFPSIKVSSRESALHIRWSKYWSFSISPSKEHSGLISFRIDWFDLQFSVAVLPFYLYSAPMYDYIITDLSISMLMNF